MSQPPRPTQYRAAFGPCRALTIPAAVHRLGARQFFVQAGPADTPVGGTLPVFPFTRIATYADGTVEIVFPKAQAGVVILVPMPEGFPVPTLADWLSSSQETTDSPA